MPEDPKQPPTLADILRPYEETITRMQEVFLFKRPLVLILILVGILAFYIFVKSSEAGFFAVIALFFVVIYAVSIIWTYLKNFLSKYLFKPLPADDPTASNRVRTLEEFCDFLEKAKKFISGSENQTKKSSLRRIIVAAVSFTFAFIFTKVDPFYFNLVFTYIAILLPGILLHPAVNKLIYKKKVDLKEPRKEEAPKEPQPEQPEPEPQSTQPEQEQEEPQPEALMARDVKIEDVQNEKKENSSSSSSSSSDNEDNN
ncbi:hypothetical protein GPJ56_005020 [Histomonas meleagridis]|uniref:uncharacterized protein n=1 Tax=Histomonas meleagridis TaxID=135588 RepID=UPI00355AC7EE|nr:hypothetical protein GPJ56_005020 [Histomonas meleagridis]KAH0802538.1 hypothetical protein GO595_004587 [Histomonas meleagridis]